MAAAGGSSMAAIPARVAAMCRSDATTSPNGTIVPRTIIQASSAHTGRWTPPRCPSRETRRPMTEPGNDHHGWTIAQKIAAKRKPKADSETGSRVATARSARRM